jgi:hypothetical protein
MPPFTQDQTSNQPALAPAPTVYITKTGPGAPTQVLAIPKTSAEVQALRSQKEQLSEELSSVASQRHALSEEIRVAPDGASRTGLEARLRLMDQRILQLESDIAATSKQLTSAPAELIAVTASETRPPGSGDDWTEGLAFGVGFALLGMAILYAYRRFRRRRSPAPPANIPNESLQRLERLEHGMEAIAIEIERVSEGQRFVTKLLSEQAPVGSSNRLAQSAGEPQPR